MFLDHTCVPLFFVISGYLFFLKVPDVVNKEYFFKKWKSRISSLLVPYIIANTLYMILAIVRHEAFIAPSLLIGYWTGPDGLPFDAPLWFLRDLMIACLCSPLVLFIIRKTNVVLPLTLLILWFLGISPIPYKGFGINGLCFFTMGAYLSINSIDIVAKIKLSSTSLGYILAYLGILTVAYYSDNTYLLNLSVLFSFPMWILLSKWLSHNINKSCPKLLITGTFFIYMYHYFYVTVFSSRVILAVLGTSEPMCFIAYIFGTLFTIGFLYGIYLLINKYLPIVSSILVGGR